MNKVKIVFLFFFSWMLLSCGFHLRGSQDLSAVLPEIQLNGVNRHSDMGRELIQALTASKVAVVDESNTILNITQNSISKRVLSVDSAGLANQYELNYQLGFTLQKKVKTEDNQQQLVDLLKPQTISEKREYLFDANSVLAKTTEETKLNNDMRQSVLIQLLRRLKFSLKSNTKIDSAVK